MMELLGKWLDSFSKWPAFHQVAFSAILVLAGLVATVILVYVAYLLVYYAVVAVRGWPDDTGRPKWADMLRLNKMIEAYREWEKTHNRTPPRLPPRQQPAAVPPAATNTDAVSAA